jgi:DNA-binding YbaB/EbfC family protein
MRIDFNTMMRHFRKMQAEVEKAREELAEKVVVEGKAADGLVTVRANGVRQILEVRIDPKAVDPQDVSMLEDLIAAAVNQALAAAKAREEETMSKITGGVKVPGLTF